MVSIPSTSSCCSSEEEGTILPVPPGDNGEAVVTVERCHTLQVNQGGGAGHNHLRRVGGAHIWLCDKNQTNTTSKRNLTKLNVLYVVNGKHSNWLYGRGLGSRAQRMHGALAHAKQ